MIFQEFNHLIQIRDAMTARVEQVVETHAHELLIDIQKSMMETPPGKPYERSWGIHWASRPEHPPAIETGALWASLKDMEKSPTEHWVGTTEGHFDDNRDFAMEYGNVIGNLVTAPSVIGALSGAGGGKPARRPYLRPAADRREPKFVADLKNAVQ